MKNIFSKIKSKGFIDPIAFFEANDNFISSRYEIENFMKFV